MQTNDINMDKNVSVDSNAEQEQRQNSNAYNEQQWQQRWNGVLIWKMMKRKLRKW